MPVPLQLQDRLGRPLRSLRLSVTDRCNLRCAYCMPEEHYQWLHRKHLLTFEELTRVTRLFAGLGVDKCRLTGGEPLLRAELPKLVESLGALGKLTLALTTNGTRLSELAVPLYQAGLRQVTVSLDTLRQERFIKLTGRDALADAVQGIVAARQAGFEKIKINTVVIKGLNDDELLDMVDFGRSVGAQVRFIEYMDVGGATRWQHAQVVNKQQILARLEQALGEAVPQQDQGSSPAKRYTFADGTVVGIIASVSEPFCDACDRIRLTADGTLYGCLYAPQGLDLRTPLRDGLSDEDLGAMIQNMWRARNAQTSKLRTALTERGPSYDSIALHNDPRLEMHTRGG